MKLPYIVIIQCAFFMMCLSQNLNSQVVSHPEVHKIVVKEVLQTTSYTYLLAEENGQVQWLAMPKIEASVGDTYYHQNGMEMVDFKSTELGRTFSSVIFLTGVIDPEIVESGKTAVNTPPQKSKPVEEKIDVVIEPAVGGISIGQLFANKEKYANKVVKIRGQVSKFNEKIMNKNWVHMQDGTSSSGSYDFVATTLDVVKVGDIITIEGLISLDKNYGSGYFYSVIMEGGKVVD